MIRQLIAALALVLAGTPCTRADIRAEPLPPSAAQVPVSLTFESPPNGDARLRFRTGGPVTALHFAPALRNWRATEWRATDSAFRWSQSADADTLTRADGAPFTSVEMTVPQRYRPLIVSYAPFAPFSDGGLLVYSGHFHACTALPCSGEGPLHMRILAPGRTIRAGDAAAAGATNYTSRGEGSQIYIGNATPQVEGGMSAIVDPALPERLRRELARALPALMAYYAGSYGPLSFQPELYVSIDSRGRGDGQESTQGGALPRQIYMHFDGARAKERAADIDSGWLDWLFAHEVAHMVQRDRSANVLGDNSIAWIHEGGADALAAQALQARGMEAYVAKRHAEAVTACRAGLVKGPLASATARGDFELHYTCGFVATAALGASLAKSGSSLDAFNRRFFAMVQAAGRYTPQVWFDAARDSGVDATTRALLSDLTGNDADKARAALDRLVTRPGAASPTVPPG